MMDMPPKPLPKKLDIPPKPLHKKFKNFPCTRAVHEIKKNICP